MSYFLRILCKSDCRIKPNEIESFVKEGGYFDKAPEFLEPDRMQTEAWTWIEISYTPTKRPITLSNIDMSDKQLFSDELEEIREVVTALQGAVADSLIRHIDRTQRIIALEIDRENISDDAWEMIDGLQAFLASRCDGLIYAPDDGFYDSKLKLIGACMKRGCS